MSNFIDTINVIEKQFGTDTARVAFCCNFGLLANNDEGKVDFFETIKMFQKTDVVRIVSAIIAIVAETEQQIAVYGRKEIVNTICSYFNVSIANPVMSSALKETGSFDGSDKGATTESLDIPYHLENMNTEFGLALREEVLANASDEARKFFNDCDYDPLRVVDGSKLTEDEWHNRRRICIGASEVSAVMGTNPFTNNVDLWHQKLGHTELVTCTPEEELKKKLIFLWGHICESYLREYIKAIPEFEGCEVHVETMIFSNEKYQFLTCNLDAMMKWPDGHWSVLEFKAPSIHTKSHYADNNIPEYYLEQMQEQMFLVNVDDAYLVALFDRDTVTYSHAIRDLDMEMEIVQECEEFWNGSVLSQIEPEPNGNGELLIKTARRYKGKGVANKTPIVLDPAVYASAFEKADILKQQLAAIEKQKKAIEEQLKDELSSIVYAMGQNTYAVCEDSANNCKYVIKYLEYPSTPKMNKANIEKLEREHPDLHNALKDYVSYSGGGRRLRELRKEMC